MTIVFFENSFFQCKLSQVPSQWLDLGCCRTIKSWVARILRYQSLCGPRACPDQHAKQYREEGKSALTSNLLVTNSIQRGRTQYAGPPPFDRQQKQALRDAFVRDRNA
jgi:hypothetical protein